LIFETASNKDSSLRAPLAASGAWRETIRSVAAKHWLLSLSKHNLQPLKKHNLEDKKIFHPKK
jgi:hypothetical protein